MKKRSKEAGRRPGGVRRPALPVAILIANSAIFLYQIMLARITSPAVFGEGIAVLAVLVLIEAPSSAIQALVSGATHRAVRGRDGRVALDLGPLMLSALAGGVVCAAVLFPVTQGLNAFLHADEPSIVLAVYAMPVILGTVPRGILAGVDDRRAVAIGLLLGSLVRLGAGTALVHSGYGITGAVAGVVIGEAVAAFVLIALARRRTAGDGEALRVDFRQAVGEGLATTGFWCLASVGVLTARHYLAAATAGQYAAATTLAELVMILPVVSAAVLFPRLIGRRADSQPGSSALARGIALVIIASLAAAGSVEALVRPILRLVFDAEYLSAVPVTVTLLLSATCLGAVTVLLQYLLSRGESLAASLPWAGIVGFMVAVRAMHASMGQIAVEMLCTMAATAVIMFAVAIHGYRYRIEDGQPSDLAQVGGDLDLSVVVPYYNPGESLAPNIRRLMAVLGTAAVTFEVIAVSDGSTDGSEQSITDIADPRLRHVLLPVNQGKGAALHVGLLAGRGRYLGFIDADGDLDPTLLETFISLIKLYEPDVVLGSKRHPLSDVRYPPLRWVYSVGYQYLVRVLFRLNVRDTQTGIKVMRRDVLAATLPRMLEKRFAFDLELLAVARHLGYRRFLEAPVVLRQRFSSTVSIRSVAHTLVDTLAIFYRLRFLRTYDGAPAETEGTMPVPIAPYLRLPRGAQLVK